MGFSLLGEELQQKMQSDTSLKKQVEGADLLEKAQETLEELFGAEQAVQAKPLFVKNRTLTVSCSSSVIAQEIRMHQKKIVSLLNKKIGKKEVDRIRYLS